MLTRRDLELISAMSQARGAGGEGRERRGCLPGCLPRGCLLPILFFICGLPIDILLVAKALGLAH
jgi:hypothetical protein